MNLAKSKTIAIRKKVFEAKDILNRVSIYLDLSILKNIVSLKGYDFENYDDSTIEQLHLSYSNYEMLLNVLESKLLSENGEITKDIVALLDKHKDA